MPEGNERPSVADLVNEELELIEEVDETEEPSSTEEDAGTPTDQPVDDFEDVEDDEDDSLDDDYEGEEDEQPDPYADLYEKLEVTSHEELIRKMEKLKVLEEMGTPPSQQQEQVEQPQAPARQALAAFTDNDYPFVSAANSKLAPDELDRRKDLTAQAFVDDPIGFQMETIGPIFERYLDMRDSHKADEAEMETQSEFLISQKDALKHLMDDGYDRAGAYKLLRKIHGQDGEKPSRTSNKSKSKPKARAKGGKVKNRNDYKKKKPSAQAFLKGELNRLFKENN